MLYLYGKPDVEVFFYHKEVMWKQKAILKLTLHTRRSKKGFSKDDSKKAEFNIMDEGCLFPCVT
jgi:hypothetical protein